MFLHEAVDAYKKEGSKYIQRLVAKQKNRPDKEGPRLTECPKAYAGFSPRFRHRAYSYSIPLDF
jgi:hypothetical protein